MAGKACRVSYRATEGTVHSVRVDADSLHEAVAKAARIFSRTGWLAATALTSEFEVEVTEPIVTHRVTMKQLLQWADGHGSPADTVRRKKVKDLLAS